VGGEEVFLDGSATATAEAFGDTGTATATATSGDVDGTYVQARAEGPVASTVVVEGSSGIGGVGDQLDLSSGEQSFANAMAMPDEAGLITQVEGNSEVNDFFFGSPDPTVVLGKVVMGATTSLDASGGIHTYSSGVDFAFDTTLIDDPEFLALGFLDSAFLGDEVDFVSMSFGVEQEGQQVYFGEFSNLDSALGFFDNNILDLGDWTADLVGFLDLSFLFEVTLGTNPGHSGFGIDFIFGNANPDAIPDPGAIPEPSTFLLMAFGVGIALYLRRRRKAEA
jgi:hypothetical protein